MPTNDFLPFATAPGANVSTQTDYAALAARTAGFSAGVASSAQVNKALRQASFIAAAVAQFTADLQAGNVADDGVIANFETQLKNAIVAQAATAFTGANRQLATAGYQKMPSGLIFQWGQAATSTAGSIVTFPVTFPNAIFSIVAGAALVVIPANSYVGVQNYNTSTFNISANTATPLANWFAIGN